VGCPALPTAHRYSMVGGSLGGQALDQGRIADGNVAQRIVKGSGSSSAASCTAAALKGHCYRKSSPRAAKSAYGATKSPLADSASAIATSTEVRLRRLISCVDTLSPWGFDPIHALMLVAGVFPLAVRQDSPPPEVTR
jgi:hypothetical protein